METRWYIVEETSGHILPLPFSKFHPAVGSKLPKNRPEHEDLGDCTVLAAVEKEAFPFLGSEGNSEVVSALIWAGVCAQHCKARLKEQKEAEHGVI